MKQYLSVLQRISIYRGIHLILTVVERWIDTIIPSDAKTVPVNILNAVKKLRASNPVQPKSWNSETTGQQLILEFSSRMRNLKINEVRVRKRYTQQMLSEESLNKVVEDLATKLSSMPIEQSLTFLENLVAEWAMTCNMDLLRHEMVEHYYVRPDETWTDQDFSGYIPYILAISTEH